MPEPRDLPRVLLIADEPGWAHDNKAHALARCLRGRFDVSVVYQAQASASDLEAADLVVVFYWQQFGGMPALATRWGAIRAKLLCGICSHVELEGSARAPGLAFLRAHAAAVFVHSELLRAEFADEFTVPFFCVPNGVDTTFYTPARGPRARPGPSLRVGWAGSIGNFGARLRGLDDVIAPAIARTAGTELVTAIREHGARDAAAMRAFYRGLDVYVCASRAEGTPNPCLEAAACGVPLLTTRVGNMPEFVRDGENGMFLTRDPDDLATKLACLRDDRVRCAAMGRAARVTSLAWDWTLQAEGYADMFACALAPRAEAVAAGDVRR
jgi:glycosyltransferase involved in cell wall biosynthesis